LSSTSDNSWLSKIYLCQFVASEVFGIDDRDSHEVHWSWLTDPINAYYAWSDQMSAGKAVGSRYYPRGVTSVLWTGFRARAASEELRGRTLGSWIYEFFQRDSVNVIGRWRLHAAIGIVDRSKSIPLPAPGTAMKMHSSYHIGSAFVLSLVVVTTASAQGPAKPHVAKDTSVEPTSWGSVVGQVYDAVTGAPIKDASVSVSGNAQFEPKGRGHGVSDAKGQFRGQAILGRVSSNFDIGRALGSGLLGMAMGSATNTTKRIDVSRVCAHIEATGYKPFEGPVAVRMQEPAAFTVTLNPILLVPVSQDGESTSAPGWGAVRMTDLKVVPAVANQEEKVKVTADVLVFGKGEGAATKVLAFCPMWGNKGQELRMKTLDPDGTAHFEYEFKPSKQKKARAEVVTAVILRSDLDIAESQRTKRALVQVVTQPSEEDAAKTRAQAFQDYLQEQTASAKDGFAKLVGTDQCADVDLESLASIVEKTSDYAGAAQYRQTILDRADKDHSSVALEMLTRDLKKSNQFDKIVSVAGPVVEKTPKRDRAKKIAPGLLANLGYAYLKTGNLDGANKINDDLVETYTLSGLDPDVIDFRNEFRVASVESDLKKDPNSASAMAEYGRVLMDEGRWEEAVQKLQQSLAVDPNSNAVKRDLAFAALHLQRTNTSTQNLDDAIVAARSTLNLQGKQKSKDFFSWHAYSMLLYSKYAQEQAKEAPDASDALAACRDALREALRCGRSGAVKTGGDYYYSIGYLSGSQVNIAGFAYPEANSDFVILESLGELADQPGDYLSSLNLASALLDLGQNEESMRWIEKTQQLKPEYTEALFLRALYDYKAGRLDVALKELQDVVSRNPRHSRAPLVLSDIFSQQGDTVSAAASVAMHNKFYGVP
jgi:tetratricopeptide (TPR) repeat protein